ncbi:hypothetical protein LPW26_03865 [Rhodopseudomonas sp. HC1]|uniref:hypothetical protein n=1 Tax=Rhodopseudomonas infernalis TaxID=2897386 RepID=UPI001EE8D2CA|nr:hypothetical protein [Rhodopseudomonas infernalis]MCG6203763.1 hypothetical protein [Rhodopseudomonas infernalis]
MGRFLSTPVQPEPIERTAHRAGLIQEIGEFWSQFFVQAFSPYRPELHYMRGPGPAWRAKHGRDAIRMPHDS